MRWSVIAIALSGGIAWASSALGQTTLAPSAPQRAPPAVSDLTTPERLALIRDGAAQPELLVELLSAQAELSEEELAALRRLDETAFASGKPAVSAASHSVLKALMLSDDLRSLGHVSQVFETFPERRHLAAAAIAEFALQKRRRPDDWRLLVRSLNVVEGPPARRVLQALLRFHERATKPRWQRQVILLGLRLGDEGAADADALLRHWTEARVSERGEPWRRQMAGWQKWFSAAHPDEPDAVLPSDPPGAKWKYDELRAWAYSDDGTRGDAGRGAVLFEKANCQKCHRFRGNGESAGPDLTEIGGRMQKKEILEAILLPSEYVSDQFFTYNVLTADGRTLTGVLAPAGGGWLTILQPSGETVKLPKSQIERVQQSKLSAMPQGTLDALTKSEIADLLAYLLSGRE